MNISRAQQLGMLKAYGTQMLSGLDARQRAMEAHVQTVLPQIGELPVLAPELEAVEVARRALEEVKAAQARLQTAVAEQTAAVQHKREVFTSVKAELEGLQAIAEMMPHQAAYYEKRIVTLGSIVVDHLGSQ